MGTSLLVFWVILNGAMPQMAKQSAEFRQGQLENAIFTDDLFLLSEALGRKGDPNRAIPMSPMRLQALNDISSRLGHYFAEETKATPLVVAAALGKGDICEALVRNGAGRFRASAWGWIPAQYAARCGYPELAQTLFD